MIPLHTDIKMLLLQPCLMTAVSQSSVLSKMLRTRSIEHVPVAPRTSAARSMISAIVQPEGNQPTDSMPELTKVTLRFA